MMGVSERITPASLAVTMLVSAMATTFGWPMVAWSATYLKSAVVARAVSSATMLAEERPGAQALVKKANAKSIKNRAENFFMKLPPLCCDPQLRAWVERT